METAASNDPYELKLYQMFQSCDKESCGFLNGESLQHLCGLLELRDKGAVLIKNLTGTGGIKPHVSFELFKEALLNFLGTELDESVESANKSSYDETQTENDTSTMHNDNQARLLVLRDAGETHIQSPDSSGREVSPKIVVGKKKYGRRSRPQSQIFDDFSQTDSDNETKDSSHRNCDTTCFNSNLVQRSSSQTDIPGSRRRRPPILNGNRLKRCASLPAQRNMQGIARSQQSNKMVTSMNNKSAQTLQNLTVSLNQELNSSIESIDSPICIETLPSNSVIDIWERANISNGRGLLLALGFEEGDINLEQLNKVLEEELRGLEEDTNSIFPRALVALQSAEVSTLRQTLRQLKDENKKLRTDNKDANQRLAMMALEIDERHASLEDSTKKEIRLLEQKHAGIVRDLTARMTNDRENWSNLSARLEARIKTFEQDEIKLKTELDLIREENHELESEQQKLQKQVTDLLEKNIKLNREITDLADNNSQCEELNLNYSKSSDDEVLRLMEKMSVLQMENTNLRDKNDELVVELENLNLDLTRVKLKCKQKTTMSTSLTETDDVSAEENEQSTSTTATKRRGDSPSKTRISEESPRMGKLRKYTNELTATASENSDTSGEWITLNSELQQTDTNISTTSRVNTATKEITRLKAKITSLEEELKKAKETTADERCKELEASLELMQRAYEDCEDYWQSKLSEERKLFEKERQFYEDEQLESDRKFTELVEKVREYEEQFNKDGRLSPIEEKYSLEQQYADLEAEVVEIRENARKMLEQKSKEIASLQCEIEDLRIRLGESVEILTGATELNNEAVQQRSGAATDHLSAASSPISYLWHQSTIQEPKQNYQTLDNNGPLSPIKQRSQLSTSETTIFSTTPVEAITPHTTSGTTNSAAPTLMPIKKPKVVSKVQSEGEVADCETSSTDSVSRKSFETHSVDTSTTESVGGRQPTKMNSTTTTTSQENGAATGVKEELKRLKFFEISLKEQIKDLSLQRDGLVMELQQLHEARPVLEKAYARAAHPSLIQRVNQLELRNRHMQNVIKQQQGYTESLMQQSWRQHQIELTELHGRIETQGVMIADQAQRLQSADILVKDLYVENSHLTATVQRMEQQRARASMIQQQQQRQGLSGLPGMP